MRISENCCGTNPHGDKIRAVPRTPSSDRQPRRLAYVDAITSGSDTGLVLADDAGTHYLLGINQAVIEAIRTVPVRKTKSAPATSTDEVVVVGPREIQAYIRGGMTAVDVAENFDIDLARVQRYEGPVLAERAWMAERARATELRRPDHAQSLGDLVVDRLTARGDDLASLEWDAWRRDDHRWVVEATWLALGTQLGEDTMAAARWVFDPVGHTIVPDDAAARALVDDTNPAAVRTAPVKRSTGGDPYQVPEQQMADDLIAVARAAEVTTPDGAMTTTDEPAWTPVVVDGGKTGARDEMPSAAESTTVDRAAQSVDVLDENSEELSSEPVRELVSEPVDLFDNSDFDAVDEPVDVDTQVADVVVETKAKTKRGRARIPSWDEILLGTQTNDPS